MQSRHQRNLVRRGLLSSAATALSLTLAACGGGGGSTGTSQPPGAGASSPVAETIGGCVIQQKAGCAAPAIGLRDKCRQPFSPDSLWNTALSRSAVLEPAGLKAATQKVYGDVAWFIESAATDPLVDWLRPGRFEGPRCSGSTKASTVRFPASVIVPDVVGLDTYNNTFSLLYPDGRTLAEGNVLARCVQGGPIYAEQSPGDGTRGRAEYDIYGSGSTGGHGGSGLSGLGGTIRAGELAAASPAIAHVLKVELSGERYLYNGPANVDQFVWPAIRADGNARTQYKGTNPKLRMGSLLALPPTTDCSTMGLATVAAQRLCSALRDYGAYIVEDSFEDTHTFVVDAKTKSDFAQEYGYPFDSYTSQFKLDTDKLFVALQVVTNNAASSVGGGSTDRLRPRATCIGN